MNKVFICGILIIIILIFITFFYKKIEKFKEQKEHNLITHTQIKDYFSKNKRNYTVHPNSHKAYHGYDSNLLSKVQRKSLNHPVPTEVKNHIEKMSKCGNCEEKEKLYASIVIQARESVLNTEEMSDIDSYINRLNEIQVETNCDLCKFLLKHFIIDLKVLKGFEKYLKTGILPPLPEINEPKCKKIIDERTEYFKRKKEEIEKLLRFDTNHEIVLGNLNYGDWHGECEEIYIEMFIVTSVYREVARFLRKMNKDKRFVNDHKEK